MKFKVGDKVRVISWNVTGTITEIFNKYNIYIRPDNSTIFNKYSENPDKCTISANEDELKLILITSNSEWKDLWDLAAKKT